MEQLENVKPEYPLLLKMLVAVGALFLGSLGILLLSIMFSMLGMLAGIGNMPLVALMEQMGVLMLGLSVLLGGGISIIGLVMRPLLSSSDDVQIQLEKQKNEKRTYDIRDYGLTVEDVLDDMSMHERERLAEKLAESRLAIRDDGTLIPLEQAEKMYKIERFIDG